MKILSWNVAGLRPLPNKIPKTTTQTHHQAYSAFIAQYDIVAIQECKLSSDENIQKELHVDGYDLFTSHHEKKGYAGVCTYVRKGGTKGVDKTPFDASLAQGRALLTKHDGFDLLNIYAPNAGRGDSHLKVKFEFYDAMKKLVQTYNTTETGIIIAGDVNTAHDEIDVYAPRKFKDGTGFLISERQWITAFLEEEKLTDSFRSKYPELRKFSFWDARTQKRGIDCGWRIDVFYISSHLKSGIIDSTIRNEIMGSDHCPILLELDRDIGDSNKDCDQAVMLPRAIKHGAELTQFFLPRTKKAKIS